jgi:hypothetical protein
MLLNLLGGIISGIWLVILGEWSEIFRGILFMVVSGFVISIALMPSLLFAAPAALAIQEGKKLLGMFFGSLSVMYTFALMTIWCINDKNLLFAGLGLKQEKYGIKEKFGSKAGEPWGFFKKKGGWKN